MLAVDATNQEAIDGLARIYELNPWGLSDASLQIVQERPRYWPLCLLAQVINDEIEASEDLRRRDRFAEPSGSEPVSLNDLEAWSLARLEEVKNLISQLDALWNSGHPPGKPVVGDVEEIIFFARRVGEFYHRAAEWSQMVRGTPVDPIATDFTRELASYADVITGGVKRFVHDSQQQIEDALRCHQPDETWVFKARLALESANVEDRVTLAANRLAEALRRRGEGEEWVTRHLARTGRLDQLRAMSPREFEQLIALLFRRMEYAVEITTASVDKGVDLFIERDGRTAIVQCKRYQGSVSQPVVRDFYGTMIHNRVHQGYIVTTGTFSLPAQNWARGKQIHLVDGAQLMDWIESFLTSTGETTIKA